MIAGTVIAGTVVEGTVIGGPVLLTVAAVVAALATGAVLGAALGRRRYGDARSPREQAPDALGDAVDTLVRVAGERLEAESRRGVEHLDARNALMDQRMDAMHRELDRLTALVTDLESARQRSHGELAAQLDRTGRTTAELARATQSLREALARPQSRGQWGERMADDVLRIAGFAEGVNYVRQGRTSGGRPDFTFLLPGGRRLHMDVKFPLDNYLRELEAASDTERTRHRAAFRRDVRARLRELGERDYAADEGDLDWVLLFLPNEHLYGAVQERDPELVDAALAQRVVLCSPLTLFAVLAVVRHAVDEFVVASRSREILEALGAFRREWGAFTGAVERLGARLDSARRAYDDVAGVRRRALERRLDRLDALRDDAALEPGDASTAGDRDRSEVA